MFTFATIRRGVLRSTLFWMVILVIVIAFVRSFFPVSGFDEVQTGELPLELASSDDGLWVLNYGELSVSLVRPSDQEVLNTTDLGDVVAPALTANDDGAWVLLDAGRTVARVDPVSGEVADRIDLGDALDEPALDLAAGDGMVWVTTGESQQMVRIDTTTGSVDEPVDLDHSVAQPQVLGDALWVNRSDGFGEYDADTGEPRRVVATDHEIHDFVADRQAIWAIVDVDNFEGTGEVVRIDPDDGTEQSRMRIIEQRPSRIAIAGDQVFVTATEGQLFEMSTDPLRLVASEQVASSDKDLRAVVVLDDRVWVADGTNAVAFQSVDDITGIPVTTLP